MRFGGGEGWNPAILFEIPKLGEIWERSALGGRTYQFCVHTEGEGNGEQQVTSGGLSQFDDPFRQGHEGVVTAVGGWVRPTL